MSANYVKYFHEHLRATILQFLADQADYEANHRVLYTVAKETGLTVQVDHLLTEIGWLKDQHLVTVRELAGLTIPQLTQRGLDVATGVAVMAGVQRPAPRA